MEKNFKQKLILGLSIGFFTFILIYGFFTTKEWILGINIKNLNITDNQTFTENPVKITGNAENASYISINDREIFIQKNGDFEEYVALLPGYNILEVKAKDKFGNEDIINYKLLLN